MLKHFGKSRPFIDAINLNLATLPVIGDQVPTDTLALIHYSEDVQIQNFHYSSTFCWTNHVSENHETVGDLTGLKGVIFKAMYIIHVGRGSLYAPRNYQCGFMSEWALDMEVQNGQFAKVLLNFDANLRIYTPI